MFAASLLRVDTHLMLSTAQPVRVDSEPYMGSRIRCRLSEANIEGLSRQLAYVALVAGDSLEAFRTLRIPSIKVANRVCAVTWHGIHSVDMRAWEKKGMVYVDLQFQALADTKETLSVRLALPL